MKGLYCLQIKNNENINLEIGGLGRICFKSGYYIYIGSAMNGLEARIRRHFKKDKKLHWHIDYFLTARPAVIQKVYYRESGTILKNRGGMVTECDIAPELRNYGLLIPDFGSSDCKCGSHLVYFESGGIRKAGRVLEEKFLFKKYAGPDGIAAVQNI